MLVNGKMERILTETESAMSSTVQEDMEEVRRMASVFKALRAKEGWPLRRPVLDFGFTYNPGHQRPWHDWMREILAEDINVRRIEGMELWDRDCYMLDDVVVPKEVTEGKGWVSMKTETETVYLSASFPKWLQEEYEATVARRNAIMARKNAERLETAAEADSRP